MSHRRRPWFLVSTWFLLVPVLTLLLVFPRHSAGESPFSEAPVKMQKLKKDMDYLKTKANAEVGGVKPIFQFLANRETSWASRSDRGISETTPSD